MSEDSHNDTVPANPATEQIYSEPTNVLARININDQSGLIEYVTGIYSQEYDTSIGILTNPLLNLRISEKVEKDLGDRFMQALHRLDTAFTLPDASIKLSKSLHSWREEVEVLFPWRKGKPTTASVRKSTALESSGNIQRTKDATTKVDAPPEGLGLRLIKRTRPHLGVRFVSKRGMLIDNQSWQSFYEASRGLSQNLLNFLSAIHYLSDFQRTWCATATGELMVTLEEMCIALRASTEDFRNPKKDSDLRKFVAVRLGVCQVQLSNLHEAMGDYERNEINHIRGIQNRAFDGLRNVTTVSTFFAGVIASTLQFSLTVDQTVPFIIINAFWLSSLVFSIGSALNSFMGMKMRKLASMTPLSKQPALIKFWIRQSDLTLLVISIFAYAVGLAVYVIKSQHSVVSIVTCAGAASCAIGIGIVWGHHVFETLIRKWGRSTGAAYSEGDDVQETDDRPSGDAESIQDHQSAQSSEDGILSHVAVMMGFSRSGDRRTIEIGDDIKDDRSDVDSDKKIPVDEVSPTFSKGDQPQVEESTNYIDLLKEIRKVSDADSRPFDHFRRGEIAHMRCSPDGKWVAICHQHACIVYDLENVEKHFVLPADDDKRSAEHAEWAEEGSVLLTRTEKELRLWKIAESASQSIHYEKRYYLEEGLCKYVKWLSQQEFLVLSDRGTLYRVDFEEGTKEATLLTQPGSKGYQVTQVYPVVAEKTEWIICLGTKLANLPQSILGDFEVEGDGVDYVLVLQKSTHAPQQNTKHFQVSVPFRKGAGPGHDAQRDTYEIRHRKILSRNIRNMKFCKYHRFVIINYDKNEIGTTAPELWELNFDNPTSWKFENVTNRVFPTPPKTDGIEGEIDVDHWGEASFAGPSHDVVVCEVNGTITFFQFNRKEGPSSLKLLDAGMPPPDFGKFFHPIFTWGDTISEPLMVATDHDGKGDVSVWKVPSVRASRSGCPAIDETRA